MRLEEFAPEARQRVVPGHRPHQGQRAGPLQLRQRHRPDLALELGAAGRPEDIVANVQAVLTHLEGARPPGAKGNFFRRAYISSTMGPGIPLAVEV